MSMDCFLILHQGSYHLILELELSLFRSCNLERIGAVADHRIDFTINLSMAPLQRLDVSFDRHGVLHIIPRTRK